MLGENEKEKNIQGNEGNEFSERFNIQMIHVESSNVEAIGYNEDLEILQIEFKNKLIYQYFNVPKDVYKEMTEANSVGQFFHTNIKNKFSGDKINGVCKPEKENDSIKVIICEVIKEYEVSVPRKLEDWGEPIRKEEIANAQKEALFIVDKSKKFMRSRIPANRLLAVTSV